MTLLGDQSFSGTEQSGTHWQMGRKIWPQRDTPENRAGGIRKLKQMILGLEFSTITGRLSFHCKNTQAVGLRGESLSKDQPEGEGFGKHSR